MSTQTDSVLPRSGQTKIVRRMAAIQASVFARIARIHKRQRRRAVTLLALLVLLLVPWSSASAQGNAVHGTVVAPGGGLPPAGTVVRLLRLNGATFGQVDVDAGGSFQFVGVPSGNYVIRAVPPTGSPYTRSLPQLVLVIHGPVDVGTLHLTDPSIVGTVYAPDGSTPTSAQIHVRSASLLVQIDNAPSGAIQVGGLHPGTYVLQAWPVTDAPYWASPSQTVVVSSGTSQTIHMTLTHADVFGYVEDASGNPVPNAIARAYAANGTLAGRDKTSVSGYFAIGGLRAGTYVLTVQPPWYEGGMVPPRPIPFTVTQTHVPTDLGVIHFGTSPKIVTGRVKTNAGTPVENALIQAHRHDRHGRARTLAGSDGTYTLRLSEGLWTLTTMPVSTTTPAHWIYPYGPQIVHFEHNLRPERKTVDFTVLTADSRVTGTVVLPGGGVPPFTVTVSLRNDEGIGRAQAIDPTSGDFDIAIPHGAYKVLVHAADPGYLGPAIDPIRVPPASTYAFTSPITLLERNAVIAGTVTVSDATGAPVADIPVHAWRPDAPGTAADRTLADGGYALAVTQGDWLVRPAPGPEQPYLYIGPPAEVDVPNDGIVPDIDFSLIETDATIAGKLVDGGGAPVTDTVGWGHAVHAADPRIHNSAPVEEDRFAILVPAGTYHVGLRLPIGARYVAPIVHGVAVTSGDTETVTLTLREKDSRIVGALWDRRAKVTVTGVNAAVTAFSEGAWLGTAVNPGNGAYTMSVASGVWTLGYRVDPASDYVALRHRRNYPVADNQTVLAPLPVAEKDGLIAGTVRDPDGAGLGGAAVIAEGVGPLLGDATLRTLSRRDGNFALAVPYGHYIVRATTGPDSGWLSPLSLRVYVPPAGRVTGLELQFLKPDATISGTVDISGTHAYSGTVHLWAWSPDDGYTRTTAPLGDRYALNVISDTTWHVGAAFQTPSQYWIAHARVPVPAGGATQDLMLRGPFPLPAPVTASFDAGEEQYLALSDGTSIYIPAGAMPVSGTVTLHVTPIATLPHQRHANVYRYGYALTACDEQGQLIEEQFNQDVLIALPYDEAELRRMGISEQWLKPAYFSTTTDSWTFPEGYIVDTAANVVAMQIDHFTDFALTGTTIYQVFLPLLRK